MDAEEELLLLGEGFFLHFPGKIQEEWEKVRKISTGILYLVRVEGKGIWLGWPIATT